MSLLLALLAAWSVWLLLDRRLPPAQVVDLAADVGGDATVSTDPMPPTGETPAAASRVVMLAGRRTASRRLSRLGRRSATAPSDLAAAVDLLAVAVTAGYSLHGAVRMAGAEGSGPTAAALGRVVAAFDRGMPLADGLAGLAAELGPAARPLSTTLSVAASSGTPLGPALQRLADAERRRTRRAAEARARRLPVLLLGPLVGLVLPAFVVLTLVPAALSSIGSSPVPTVPLPPSSGPVGAVAPGR